MTSKLDRKIKYHENRTFLFCMSIFYACLQPLWNMLLLPTTVLQTTHGNSSERCRIYRPATDHNRCLTCIYPRSLCARMLKRGRAQYWKKKIHRLCGFFPCQGHPDTSYSIPSMMEISYEVLRGNYNVQNRSRCNAFSTMMKNRGLRTECWWIPTSYLRWPNSESDVRTI